MKGVPPMVVGKTWADWANSPTAADMPPPSPLASKYAAKRRISQRQLDRRTEAAKVEELTRKAAEAVAALQAALPKKKSRSGPSGWTREWNKAKQGRELEKACDRKRKADPERKKAELESDKQERDSFDTGP